MELIFLRGPMMKAEDLDICRRERAVVLSLTVLAEAT